MSKILKIQTVVVTSFSQNCRVLSKEGGKKAVVVDPGGDAGRIKHLLDGQGLLLHEIWLTHSHLDHCGGVAELRGTSKVPLIGHPAEKMLRANVEQIQGMYGLAGEMRNCPEPDRYVAGGETLEFEGFQFEVLFTPGHAPGHVCFYEKSQDILLAGDTIFAGSIGRTDLPGGDSALLMKSIREKLLVLPPQTSVLPGHGSDTTIGQELQSNPFVLSW